MADGILDVEIVLGHVDVGMADDTLDGGKINAQSLKLTDIGIENCKDIVIYLAKKAASADWRTWSFWDYFGPITGFKNIVWSKENVIQFAFCLYKLFESACDDNPFIQILSSNDYDADVKLSVCEVVTDLYDQGQLNAKAYDTIKEIEDLTGIYVSRCVFCDKLEHNFFQDMLSKLSKNDLDYMFVQELTEHIRSEEQDFFSMLCLPVGTEDEDCLQFFVAGYGYLLLGWTSRNFDTTADEMGKKFERLLHLPLFLSE